MTLALDHKSDQIDSCTSHAFTSVTWHV